MDNHIILTRFNQQLNASFSPTNMYEGENSWMSHRIKLFEKYTLKSWLSQSDNDFHLFLISDPQTPSSFKKILNNYESHNINIKIIYSNESCNSKILLDKVKEIYLNNRKNSNEEIVISRCDNDDLISVHYNAVIKQISHHNTLFNLSSGMTYDPSIDKACLFNFPKSPFVSLKSNLSEFKSPFFTQHNRMDAEAIFSEYPLWCWVIHDRNANNTLKGVPIDNFDPLILKNLFGYE